MKFGIKTGSSKKITLVDIQKKLKEQNSEENHIELFIAVCYELAEEHDMTAAIYLDNGFTVDKDNELKTIKVLNVKFRCKGY